MAPTDSVHDLFRHALRREREVLPNPGPLLQDEDGATVRFGLKSSDGVVRNAEYQCTTCATLVAVCELLKQRAAGAPIASIAEWRVDGILVWLPGIPPSHHSRVAVALRALQEAL